MAFKSWMETQDWEDKQLDKDLIGDGKLYSPENCVFVSRSLNQMLNCGASGEYPIGVCRHKSGKFAANVKTKGDRKYLGLFSSPDEAHSAWRIAKLEIARGYLERKTIPVGVKTYKSLRNTHIHAKVPPNHSKRSPHPPNEIADIVSPAPTNENTGNYSNIDAKSRRTSSIDWISRRTSACSPSWLEVALAATSTNLA